MKELHEGKMVSTKWRNILWVLVSITLLTSLYLLPEMKGPVPSHWNFTGQPDQFVAPWVAAIVFPVVNALLYALLLLLPKLDPRRNQYAVFKSTYVLFVSSVTGFMSVFLLLINLSATGRPIHLTLWIRVLLGILLLILGNWSGRVRQNYFMGVRTPWTLANETVWNKTQRVAGKSLVLSGILTLVGAFLPDAIGFGLMAMGVLCSVLISTVYSYWIYRSMVS